MARGAVVESSLPVAGEEAEEFDEHGNPIEQELPEEGEEAEEERAERIEAEARRQGWRPLAEFAGDPKKFVSAEEFIERGRNFVPFLQKDLDKANTTVANLENQIVSMRGELGEVKLLAQSFRDAALKAEQRGYDRAMAELEARRREAVESANVEGYDAANAEIAALNADRPQTTAPPKPNGKVDPPPQPGGEMAPEVTAFIAANPWFTKDATLNAVMQSEHMALLEAAPGLPLTENLKRAKDAVMKRFPAKFGRQPAEEPAPQPRRRSASVLDPSGAAGPTPARAGGINSIADEGERAEARRQFERQKVMMPGYTEAQFMRLYTDPHADVLEVIRQKPARRQQ